MEYGRFGRKFQDFQYMLYEEDKKNYCIAVIKSKS